MHKRSLNPRQRSTADVIASLDERATRTTPKRHGQEWQELRRRMRAQLAANAAGDQSAADVVANLYAMGWDR